MEMAAQDFDSLSPDRILNSVEKFGVRCTGRILQLNSLENRVYEVEIETESTRSPSDKFKVVKFYRPNRWTREQILEEHTFLFELENKDLSVIAPIRDGNGESIYESENLFFALFPKRSGRSNPEPSEQDLRVVGRTLARIHNIGATRPATGRISLNAQTFGLEALDFIISSDLLDTSLHEAFRNIVGAICQITTQWLQGVQTHRIHGDCHFGNVVWSEGVPMFLDFDDMCHGPAVQDIWLLVPGRDSDSEKDRQILIDAYQEFRSFDITTLRLIEPLRAMRYMHYAAWIAARKDDPYFKKTFPNFGTQEYWRSLLSDLNEQLHFLHGI